MLGRQSIGHRRQGFQPRQQFFGPLAPRFGNCQEDRFARVEPSGPITTDPWAITPWLAQQIGAQTQRRAPAGTQFGRLKRAERASLGQGVDPNRFELRQIAGEPPHVPLDLANLPWGGQSQAAKQGNQLWRRLWHEDKDKGGRIKDE